MNDESTHAVDARTAAQDVLISVARDEAVRSEYPTMTSAIDDASLRHVVDIAWRYQFDPDRYAFKRDIRALQEYVSQRARQLMEAE